MPDLTEQMQTLLRPVPEEAQQCWLTADGTPIRFCDLEDNHLRNILFFCQRRHGYNYPDEIMGARLESEAPYAALLREADRRHLRWFPEEPNE
jgi:hypothetical protein